MSPKKKAAPEPPRPPLDEQQVSYWLTSLGAARGGVDTDGSSPDNNFRPQLGEVEGSGGCGYLAFGAAVCREVVRHAAWRDDAWLLHHAADGQKRPCTQERAFEFAIVL